MFCNKCGAKIDDDSDFCTECGAPVVEDAADKSQATVDPKPEPEPEPAPEPEPEPESTPAPEPATASEPEPEQPRRSRVPMVIIGVSAAVILVCVGILLAFTVFKPRTYAVNLPVSIPGLDEAGSRVPVQAHRVDVQTGPTVHVYLSSTGDGLELEPGTWEIKPEGSPIAKDGTIYQYEVEPVTMQVDKGEGDTVTARASETLELAPVSPAFVTDDQVSKAVEWAKGDAARPSTSVSAPSVDELAKTAKDKKGTGACDLVLSKLKWVQESKWFSNLGLSDLPANGPVIDPGMGNPFEAAKSNKVDYAIADINNDGVCELFLVPSAKSTNQDGSSSSEIMTAYTFVDGSPVCFAQSPWYYSSVRGHRGISNDGRIVFLESGGMYTEVNYYKLSGGQLELTDKYISDHMTSSAPSVTHNGESISDDDFRAAANYQPYEFDWKPVSDYALPDPQPVDESTVSDLCASRLKAVRQAIDILYPLVDPSSGPGGERAMGFNGEPPSAYYDLFKLGNRAVGYGYNSQEGKKSSSQDSLSGALNCVREAKSTSIASVNGLLAEVSPVANDMVKVSLVGSSSYYAPAGSPPAKDTKLELLVTFDDGSALIDSVIPLTQQSV